jgi:hypothetical protein
LITPTIFFPDFRTEKPADRSLPPLLARCSHASLFKPTWEWTPGRKSIGYEGTLRCLGPPSESLRQTAATGTQLSIAMEQDLDGRL